MPPRKKRQAPRKASNMGQSASASSSSASSSAQPTLQVGTVDSDDDPEDNIPLAELLGGRLKRGQNKRHLGSLSLNQPRLRKRGKVVEGTPPSTSILSNEMLASSEKSSMETGPTGTITAPEDVSEDDEEEEEEVEEEPPTGPPSRNLRQNPVPTQRLNPNPPIHSTPVSSIAASSTPSSHESNPPEDCFQVLGTLNIVQRKSLKPTCSLNKVFTRDDMLIGIEAAELVTSLPGRFEPYIGKLLFARLNNVIAINKNFYSIDLEPHVNILVQYMCHLLSRKGLETVNIIITTRAHLTEPNYFVQPSAPVLSKNLVNAILNHESLGKSLRRIPDNWKTMLKNKIVHVKQAVKQLYDYDDILEGTESILRPVSKHCMFNLFHVFNYISSSLLLQVIGDMVLDVNLPIGHTIVQAICVGLNFMSVKDIFLEKITPCIEATVAVLLLSDDTVPCKYYVTLL
jgi:hypothetical protein